MTVPVSPPDSVSCLVVSRTPALINRLLPSLLASRSGWGPHDEVLCSWNGPAEMEAEINPALGPCPQGQPAFRIAQRDPYHFASNMNALAEQAKGDVLALINDDLILDPGSLDQALAVLHSNPSIGVVGGKLRSSAGQLTHAGLLFDQHSRAYNRFRPDDIGALLDLEAPALQDSGPMPAVTGALMLIRRRDFLRLKLRTDYAVCGEDIALCLDLWTELGHYPYYASDVTAIHDEKTTRGSTSDQEDLEQLARFAASRISQHPELLANLQQRTSQEGEFLWQLVQQLRQECADTEARLEATEASVQAMESSTSWKLTAPLRRVADNLNARSATPPSPGPSSDPGHAAHLIFDALILAQAHRASVSRGGIYRYASELLVALSQPEGQAHWPHSLLPFCADPLLAGSADRELADLEQRFGVSLRPAGDQAERSKPVLPEPPPRLKRLLKPLHRRLLQSSPMRARAQRRFEACLRDAQNASTIFHTPFQSVPEAVRRHGLPHVVVTVHDMLPRIHPEFFTQETVRQFEALLGQLQPSDHVICVSESTRRDLLQAHPCTPRDQVHVTPLAASPQLGPVHDPAQRQALREQLGLQAGDQVLLSLCTLEPRKNLSRLISAFEQLRRHADGAAIKLVLAGSLGWKTTALSEQIRSSPASDAILLSGHIPDQQLACLYSLADAFVYPSLYEGFGLPPLEAMQCGAPVIVGNTSSLPEVVGSAALLVDPRSTSELAEAMATLLGSAETRQRLQHQGLAQAAQFSWARTAALTTEVYRTMLERRG